MALGVSRSNFVEGQSREISRGGQLKKNTLYDESSLMMLSQNLICFKITYHDMDGVSAFEITFMLKSCEML